MSNILDALFVDDNNAGIEEVWTKLQKNSANVPGMDNVLGLAA
jgi:hypothetical protein